MRSEATIILLNSGSAEYLVGLATLYVTCVQFLLFATVTHVATPGNCLQAWAVGEGEEEGEGIGGDCGGEDRPLFGIKEN